MNDGALSGITVVSIEQAVAAPVASCKLADAGARVLKIERPEGDFARGYDHAVRGESAYFVWLNRGKESVVLDYTRPEDAALLQAMIARADVLIQNLGPGAAKRAGFGSDDMRRAYPRLITCDISGYGEEGPYSDLRAYDLMVQAESGVASITGTPDAPGRIGVSACDIATGMNAHAAILQALIRRGRTGEGSAITVSLFHSMADWMAVPVLYRDYAGRDWPRVGLAHPLISPYGAYVAADGVTVMLGVQNDGEWRRFAAEVLERPELGTDPAFARNVARVENRAAVDELIAAVLRDRTADQMIERLRAARIAFARVNDVAALSAHPQLRRVEVETPAGTISVVAPPARVRGETPTYGPVPKLGQHTDAVRAEFSAPA
jgi:crotonobetainyl-CoA:carnitine CoA-transferase CaiB-like acyl-CoA transferase